ncbi:MAG: hypothetical protein OJJ54_24960 [Pseudonocardia sp.]|nr:hypothetical protein [Pseudonocardia sp.]
MSLSIGETTAAVQTVAALLGGNRRSFERAQRSGLHFLALFAITEALLTRFDDPAEAIAWAAEGVEHRAAGEAA